MKPSIQSFVMAFGLIVIGIAFAFAGIYIGEADDAPGTALIGILLMIGMAVLGVRTLRRGRNTTMGNKKPLGD